ncbi:unnamed protein product [Lactuca saligna]|uniref:DDE Tnp4 domain-containing protein n=1 Tax=Lactuca saligna TaxID=75948 RepID=A0AA36EEZ5_LACSI|nr:unnamed protein product [Lactuca saligna]
MRFQQVCVTFSVCEAQTTRRHNGLQSVCFSEVRRHKNVCARSSPHRYGIASSKVCKPFNLKKTRLFFFFCFRLQSSSNPPRKNPRSIDRTPPCSDHHRRNPPLRSKPSITAFLSDPASSDFPTITVDCSSRRTTRSQRQLQLATKRRLLPCSPPLTSASPVKPPPGDRRPHSYTGDFDLTATGSDGSRSKVTSRVAHDSRILSEAVADPQASFPFPPPDKYYLCDAAYAHTRGFMAPYRNVSKEIS